MSYAKDSVKNTVFYVRAALRLDTRQVQAISSFRSLGPAPCAKQKPLAGAGL